MSTDFPPAQPRLDQGTALERLVLAMYSKILEQDQDMDASFAQVSATMVTKQELKQELAAVEERIDKRLDALEGKMDRILALLTKGE